ncbi:MAG: hypothetical protein ACI4IL_04530 [Eubacterium sp.]
MKNFNDVFTSFDEVINNARKNGTFEEVLNKTKAYAKKSSEAIEISRKKIELLDAKTKLAKIYEKYGKMQFELYDGNDIDEEEQNKLIEEIVMLRGKIEFIEEEIEAFKEAIAVDFEAIKNQKKENDIVVEDVVEVVDVVEDSNEAE